MVSLLELEFDDGAGIVLFEALPVNQDVHGHDVDARDDNGVFLLWQDRR
jgi:hypothetical protein